MVNRFSFFLMFLLFPLLAWGEIYDRIEVIVGNRVITKNEIELSLIRRARQQNIDLSNATTKENFRKEARDELINGLLLIQRANEIGLSVGSSTLDAIVEETRQKRNLSQQAFEELLAAEGLSLSQFKKVQLEQTLQSRVIGREVRSKVVVDEQELRKSYDNIQTEVGLVKVRHLLLRVKKDASAEEEKQILARVQEIRQRVLNEDNFPEMIQLFSQDPAKEKKKGVLGPFRKGELLKEFAEASFALEIGRISQPVRTQFGYHLIEVLEKLKEPKKPFAEVKQQLREKRSQELFQEIFRSYLDQLKKKIKVQFLEEPS